jgi:hypothetical protein
MASKPPPPSPERDRAIAAQPRYGRRNAVAVSDIVDGIMHSADIRRIRRFQKVTETLRANLDARILTKIRPLSFKNGTLLLSVSDHVQLAEMQQHHERRLLSALVANGCGVDRLQWRLARSNRA